MSKTDMKNLHVPLPQPMWQRLRAQAKLENRPATVLAREAIDLWLAQQYRVAVHDAISSYARQVAGTSDDLDVELETASVEHMVNGGATSEQAGGQ